MTLFKKHIVNSLRHLKRCGFNHDDAHKMIKEAMLRLAQQNDVYSSWT